MVISGPTGLCRSGMFILEAQANGTISPSHVGFTTMISGGRSVAASVGKRSELNSAPGELPGSTYSFSRIGLLARRAGPCRLVGQRPPRLASDERQSARCGSVLIPEMTRRGDLSRKI